MLASYFFDQPNLRLFSIRQRGAAKPMECATLPNLPAHADAKRPVYVLTSSSTFSAGEGFAWLLQERGRAKVIER